MNDFEKRLYNNYFNGKCPYTGNNCGCLDRPCKDCELYQKVQNWRNRYWIKKEIK